MVGPPYPKKSHPKAPQNTREASNHKRITRRREHHQMRKVDPGKYTDRDVLAD